MDPLQYKKYHEQMMSNNNGTSVEECQILLSALPFFVFFGSWISSHVPEVFFPVVEFIVTAIPVILNVTILSDLSPLIFIYIVVLYLITTLCNLDIYHLRKTLNSKIQENKIFITNYRAFTNLVSAVCILAVDFNIFPRRLAKTETFGFGFMDLGVGFFVCSHGLVQKDKTAPNQFKKLFKSCFVFFILGVFRLASVKSLEYHEHVTEYGVHWNFFFTLMFCRILTYIILHLSNHTNPVYLALATGITHQTFLWLGLERWVLSDIPRNSILPANREGISSVLGFVSLYFAANSIGKYIMFSNYKTYKSLIVKLTITCFVAWMATFFFHKTFGVSRKLANLGYVSWILASSLIVLILFIVTELTILAMSRGKKCTSDIQNKLLQSINANGLFFFLLSNLLTGVINIFFQTLLLEKTLSIIIITSYTLILCSATYFLYLKQIFIKF